MDGITYSNAMSSMAPIVGGGKAEPASTGASSENNKTNAQAMEAVTSTTYTSAIRKEPFQLSYSEEEVIKAVEKANKAIMGPPKKFEYSVHKGTGDIIVKVVNSETNEVLKELPPEKLLDIVDRIVEATGVIIDERR